MPGPASEAAGAAPASPDAAASAYRKALTLLATLFFMWVFISVINNTLLPHLRSIFELNFTQTTFLTAACELYVRFYALWGCRSNDAGAKMG